jgi:hypothetical protein
MRITSKSLAGLIFIFIFGGILVSTWMNWWQTESNKIPAKFTQGDYAGEYNPADIRGSYTFGDIETTFNIPADLLAKAFVLPADVDALAFQVNSLELLYSDLDTEFGTASIRLFVALYAMLPYEITDDTYLPIPAVEILKQHGSLTPEQIGYIDAHSIPVGNPTSKEPATESSPEPESSVSHFISGKTTFREVLDWGVSQAAIESVLGGEMPNPLQKIKDYCIENNLLFETVKSTLQVEVDKAP